MPRQTRTVKKSYKPRSTRKQEEPDTKPFFHEQNLDDYFGLTQETVKKPGKHRFFEQNYQHPLYHKDNGYAIAYQYAGNADVLDRLIKLTTLKEIEQEFEPHVLEFLESGFLTHSSWDRFEQDLKKVSLKPTLKDCLIVVKCIAEDFSGITNDEIDNLYIYYIKDGKAYSENAEIYFPPFEHSRLL